VDRRQREAVTARTAAEIEAGATRCANALRARGVVAGRAVGVALGDGQVQRAALRALDLLRAVPIRIAAGASDAALRAALGDATALVHERSAAERVAAARRSLPRLRVVLSVDDGSDTDLTDAGSEDFDSALAGAATTRDHLTS
jgi:fatty-acyl-CoA synthase